MFRSPPFVGLGRTAPYDVAKETVRSFFRRAASSLGEPRICRAAPTSVGTRRPRRHQTVGRSGPNLARACRRVGFEAILDELRANMRQRLSKLSLWCGMLLAATSSLYWIHLWHLMVGTPIGPDPAKFLALLLPVLASMLVVGLIGLRWAKPRRWASMLLAFGATSLAGWVAGTTTEAPKPRMSAYVAPVPAWYCGQGYALPKTANPEPTRAKVAEFEIQVDPRTKRLEGKVVFGENNHAEAIQTNDCEHGTSMVCSFKGGQKIRVAPLIQSTSGGMPVGSIFKANAVVVTLWEPENQAGTSPGQDDELYSDLILASASCGADDVERAAYDNQRRYERVLWIRDWYQRNVEVADQGIRTVVTEESLMLERLAKRDDPNPKRTPIKRYTRFTNAVLLGPEGLRVAPPSRGGANSTWIVATESSLCVLRFVWPVRRGGREQIALHSSLCYRDGVVREVQAQVTEVIDKAASVVYLRGSVDGSQVDFSVPLEPSPATARSLAEYRRSFGLRSDIDAPP